MIDFDVVDALAGFAEDLKSEAAFADRLHAAVVKMKQERDEARAENERLRHVLADIREWAKHDHVMRFDDGDVPLADYCTQAIQGEKP